jgi:hypothetical protein|eukprot:SAG31_NODE_2929_length_4899_cov_1.752292_2_plen_132_part_00
MQPLVSGCLYLTTSAASTTNRWDALQDVGARDLVKINAATLSATQLTDPVKEGMLHKEGHRRKTWKQRQCVVWPADYEERGLSAPVLFYYDPNDLSTPKGTISLANLKCRLPKTKRKDQVSRLAPCAMIWV